MSYILKQNVEKPQTVDTAKGASDPFVLEIPLNLSDNQGGETIFIEVENPQE